MNKKLVVAVTLASVLGLSACNTMNGAGKDMKSAGSAVSDASGKDKPKGK